MFSRVKYLRACSASIGTSTPNIVLLFAPAHTAGLPISSMPLSGATVVMLHTSPESMKWGFLLGCRCKLDLIACAQAAELHDHVNHLRRRYPLELTHGGVSIQ